MSQKRPKPKLTPQQKLDKDSGLQSPEVYADNLEYRMHEVTVPIPGTKCRVVWHVIGPLTARYNYFARPENQLVLIRRNTRKGRT
jgi:hypothetical protein